MRGGFEVGELVGGGAGGGGIGVVGEGGHFGWFAAGAVGWWV